MKTATLSKGQPQASSTTPSWAKEKDDAGSSGSKQEAHPLAEYVAHLKSLAESPRALCDSIGEFGDQGILTDEDFTTMALVCKRTSMQQKPDIIKAFKEQIYSCVPWVGHVAITIFTEERQGKGDISLGLKTVQMYREELNRRDPFDVVLITDEISIERKGVRAFIESFEIRPLIIKSHIKLDGGFPATARGKGPQAFLYAPMLTSKGTMNQRGCFKFAPESETQHIWFTEYSKVESDSVPTGLSPDQLGITVDSGLRKYKKALEECETEPEKRVFRRKHLKLVENSQIVNAILAPPGSGAKSLQKFINTGEVDPKTLEAFIGDDGEADGVEISLDGPRKEPMAIDQQPGVKFYFGYSNRSGSKFCKVLANLEEGRNHVCAVHAGGHYIEKYLPAFKAELKGDFGAELKKLKFGMVEIVEFDLVDGALTAKEPEIIQVCDSPASLRLIFPPRVAHPDMLNLFQASEPVAIVTGNQSTSEALSAGKTLIYECLSFKQNQAFMKELFEMGAKTDGDDGKMMELHGALRDLCKDIISKDKEKVPENTYADVAKLLRDGRMDAGFQMLSDLACTTRNLTFRLLGMYKRNLLLSYGEIKGALVDLESSFGRTPTAEDFERFYQGLQSILDKAKSAKN